MFLQVSVCPHWGDGCGFIWHGGHAWFYLGGMRGFIWGACVVLFWGHAWFYSGGHAWFYLGACMVLLGGMHGFIQERGHVWFYSGGHAWFYLGACVVLFGGHAWFYLGGMCGFIPGDMHGFIWGGTCMVFSVFSDTMRYGQ